MRRFAFWLLTFSLLIVLFAIPATAQSGGTIRELTGKVEIQEPGGSWVAARPGMVVSIGATISTGFRSSAVVELNSASLQVAQLTRMTVEELVEKQGVMTTGLYLKVGKITAQVKTGETISQDFKLRSAVSTAAVRGTTLIYTPFSCVVKDGIVSFFNQLNQRRTLLASQQSGISGTDPPSDPEIAFAGASDVPAGLLGSPVTTVGGSADTATIVIRY
jgi:hypothetical protein